MSLGGATGTATGRGVSLMVREWARTNSYNVDQLNVVVQGFGNVGGVAAALRVNASVHSPLLCVADVFKVASGQLSLPGQVETGAPQH